MVVVETASSEKIKLFSGVSFLVRTITRRIREISENVKYNQGRLVAKINGGAALENFSHCLNKQ